jgi:hypothetical protein
LERRGYRPHQNDLVGTNLGISSETAHKSMTKTSYTYKFLPLIVSLEGSKVQRKKRNVKQHKQKRKHDHRIYDQIEKIANANDSTNLSWIYAGRKNVWFQKWVV